MCIISKPVRRNIPPLKKATTTRQRNKKHKTILPLHEPTPQSLGHPSFRKHQTSNLHVMSWNMNSFRPDDNKLVLLGCIHDTLVNVICIQESRLTEEEIELLKKDERFAGFKIFGSPAHSTKPGSLQSRGLLTMVSKSLISDLTSAGFSKKCGLGVEILSVSISTHKGDIHIHNTYVHQDSATDALNIKVSKGNHVMVGDFNAHHQLWDPINIPSNSRGNRLCTMLQDSSDFVLSNKLNVPTTIDNSTLTLTLVSPTIAPITDWKVMEHCISNPHIATLTSIDISPEIPLPPFEPKLKIEKANWQRFGALSNIPINSPTFQDTTPNLENICLEFEEAVHAIIQETIPTTRQHDRIPASEQWWFGDKSKKAKQELRAAARANKLKIPGSRAALRPVRAKTLEVFRLERHEKWNAICQSLNLSSSLGSHWRRLRWLYNGGIPPQKALMQYAKAKEMADEAMYLFSERSSSYNLRYVTRAVLNKLQEERETEVETAIQTNSKLCSSPFTIRELKAVLTLFKSTSPGEDNIPYIVLANLGKEFQNHLVHLINTSLELQKSPLQWKTVPLIPVPKKEK